MSRESLVRIHPRFVAFAVGALLLIMAGLILETPSWIVAGIFVAASVGIGTRTPRRVTLAYHQSLSQPTPTEGQTVTLEAELRNPTWRTPLVEWKIRLPGVSEIVEGPTAGWAALRPRTTGKLRADARFLLFGLQRVGPLDVRVGDVFGFSSIEWSVGEAQEVRVYPHSASLNENVVRARQLRSLYGAYEIPRPGHGFEFFGLRSYTVGDRPRDVNWKASARYGDYIVNQREKEADAEVVVILDARAASLVGRQVNSPFAQGGRAALAIAEAHLHARDAVRFVAYGAEVHRDLHTGAVRSLQGILNLLVGLEPRGDIPLKEVVDTMLPALRPRSPIVVVSCLTEDITLEESFARLYAADLPIRIVVPKPDWDGVAETPERRVWDAAQRYMALRLRQMGLPVIEISKDRPLEACLAQLEAAK